MPINLRFATTLLFVILTGVAISACGQKEGSRTQNSAAESETAPRLSPRNVRVLELKTRDLVETLVLAGTLRPDRGADIRAEEPGTVSKVYRDKGASVERGQHILSIDRRILAAEMKSTAADEKLRAFNEERTRTLFDENSVSGQEMLLVHTQAEQAEALAEIARVRYERAAFPAPFTGIVSERYVEVGEYISPGTRVARILDPWTLKLHGSVTDRQVQSIETGASVRIILPGSGDPTLGTVSWIGFEAEELSGKFAVEIEIPNPELTLRPGTLARAEIQTVRHSDIVAIPRDAIVQTELGPIVFIATGNHAVRRSVSLGAEQGLLVIVRSGVETGERLIVRGQRDLSDGAPIRVQETATEPDGSISQDRFAPTAAPITIRQNEAGNPEAGDPE